MNAILTKLRVALIIQHPRIHLRERLKPAKGKGTDGIKFSDNLNIRRLQEKGKHTGDGNLGASANDANFTVAENYGYNDDKVEATTTGKPRPES